MKQATLTIILGDGSSYSKLPGLEQELLDLEGKWKSVRQGRLSIEEFIEAFFEVAKECAYTVGSEEIVGLGFLTEELKQQAPPKEGTHKEKSKIRSFNSSQRKIFKGKVEKLLAVVPTIPETHNNNSDNNTTMLPSTFNLFSSSKKEPPTQADAGAAAAAVEPDAGAAAAAVVPPTPSRRPHHDPESAAKFATAADLFESVQNRNQADDQDVKEMYKAAMDNNNKYSDNNMNLAHNFRDHKNEKQKRRSQDLHKLCGGFGVDVAEVEDGKPSASFAPSPTAAKPFGSGATIQSPTVGSGAAAAAASSNPFKSGAASSSMAGANPFASGGASSSTAGGGLFGTPSSSFKNEGGLFASGASSSKKNLFGASGGGGATSSKNLFASSASSSFKSEGSSFGASGGGGATSSKTAASPFFGSTAGAVGSSSTGPDYKVFELKKGVEKNLFSPRNGDVPPVGSEIRVNDEKQNRSVVGVSEDQTKVFVAPLAESGTDSDEESYEDVTPPSPKPKAPPKKQAPRPKAATPATKQAAKKPAPKRATPARSAAKVKAAKLDSSAATTSRRPQAQATPQAPAGRSYTKEEKKAKIKAAVKAANDKHKRDGTGVYGTGRITRSRAAKK